ncbi:hypothetical protein ACQPWR_14275 [Micromonospora vinacea]|uniref:hypothetical protein n=1 Tax=Micromonospora vinacea TaxID=709878 RepID=UPI003D89EC94
MSLPQGDVKLLDTPLAQRLLAASLTEVEGVLPEYATIQRAGMGDEMGNAYLAAIDQPGLRMVRIGLRPTWVGVVDFQERFPARTPQPVRAALSGGR